MKTISVRAAALLCCLLPAMAHSASSHVVVLIDESPSMDPRMLSVLDTLQTLVWSLALADADPKSVTVTVIGYTDKPRLVEIDGRKAFPIEALPDALERIRIDRSGQEDGYRAIDLAIDEFADTATELILITDEDRDAADPGLAQHTILERLHRARLPLDVMANVRVQCKAQSRGLGRTADGQGFAEAETGGYTRCRSAKVSSGHGTTFIDYGALALASGGSVWNLNVLTDHSRPHAASIRAADALSQSFTALVAARRHGAAAAAPRARPVVRPAIVLPGEAISLSGALSQAGVDHDAIGQWAWDLDGDGSPDNYGPDVGHVYTEPGLHALTLTVRDSAATATAPIWVYVQSRQ